MSIRLLNSGVIIGGKYQITAALGGNPVGITYAGTAVQTAQKVIIREFMPQDCCERAADGSIINAADVFEQEKQKYIAGAKILLANPGQAVTQVYELLEENGTVYTIMEYVEGISLDAYLTQNKNRFPVGRIQVLIQPLLADFARLQEMGFIHGNISPDNLIFSNAGSLKLTGFGYVQGKVSLKSDAYAAAEMFQTQQPVSMSADVYALCASIYRCITGAAPQEAYRRMSQDMLQKPSGSRDTDQHRKCIDDGYEAFCKGTFSGNEGFCKSLWSGTGCHTCQRSSTGEGKVNCCRQPAGTGCHT